MKEHIQRRIIAISVCTLLYLLLFPLRLSFEPVISRAWGVSSQDINSLQPLTSDDDAIALHASDKLFFINSAGTRIYSAGEASGTSVGDGIFARMESNGSISLHTQSGEMGATLKENGIPWFSGNSLFILSDTGTAVSAYTAAGEYRWRFEADNPVSALCALPKGDVFLGLVDGRVFWLDDQGGIKLSQVVGHGRNHVVYNLLWLEQRHELAALVDLEPQSLILLKPVAKAANKAAHFETMADTVITESYRTPVFMGTSARNTTVFLQQPSGIGLVSPDGREPRVVDLGGTVLNMNGVDAAGLLIATVENESGSALLGFMGDSRFLFKQRIRGHLDDLSIDKKGRIIVSSGAGIVAFDFLIR